MSINVCNCCKVLAIHPKEEYIVFSCNRSPEDNEECKFRPIANINEDWCDNSSILKFVGKDVLVCNCVSAQLGALDEFINKINRFKEKILQCQH